MYLARQKRNHKNDNSNLMSDNMKQLRNSGAMVVLWGGGMDKKNLHARRESLTNKIQLASKLSANI